MNFLLLRLAGTIELGLICAEGLMPGTHDALPLGGNHLAQVGLVFGMSFILTELIDLTFHFAHGIIEWLRGFG